MIWCKVGVWLWIFFDFKLFGHVNFFFFGHYGHSLKKNKKIDIKKFIPSLKKKKKKNGHQKFGITFWNYFLELNVGLLIGLYGLFGLFGLWLWIINKIYDDLLFINKLIINNNQSINK